MHITKYLHTQNIDNSNILLLNTLTGAIDKINASTYRMIQNNDLQHIEVPVLNKLIARKYIFESLSAEKKFFNSMIAKIRGFNKQREKMLSFYFCITYNCNMRCTYCNASNYVFPGNSLTMSINQIDSAFAIVRSITSRTDLEKSSIILYGGEPLMVANAPIVSHFIKRANEWQIPTVIITNGLELDLILAAGIKFSSQLCTFIITLDGPREIHNIRRPDKDGFGTFEKIIKNINWLVDTGFRTEIQAILDAQNIHFLPQLCDFILRKKWHKYPNIKFFIGKTTFIVNENSYKWYLSEDEFVKKIFKEINRYPLIDKVFRKFTGSYQIASYFETIIKYKHPSLPLLDGCRACNPGLYVFCPDGKVYPCLELINIESCVIGEYHPKVKWFHTNLNKWRTYDPLSYSDCLGCKYIFICGGGCPAQKLIEWKSSNKKKCQQVIKVIDLCLAQNRKFAEALSENF